MSEANPSPAFTAPGNPDKSILGGDNDPSPPKFAPPGNGSGSMPDCSDDTGGTPRCAPYAPTPEDVKRMFRG